MKYKIRKLDGRYSYREYFKYCIVFHPRMSPEHKGILWFNDVKQWFERTYGHSAEIRDWDSMRNYHFRFGVHLESDLPNHVNFNWSWTNGYDDLRIYIKGDKELGFFKLANPVDSTH